MGVIEYIDSFYKEYSGEKGIIGFSEKGLPIRYFLIEKSQSPVVIVTCAIHAREYITSYLCLEELKYFDKNAREGKVYFIPAVNPDGIKICENTCPQYKSNGNGVDLNVNFDARWGKGRQNKREKGIENYMGEYPFSESETRALRDFTLYVKPNLTFSYHSKGEEIYYYFFQKGKNLERDYSIAKKIAQHTGYSIKEPKDSCGGYKDWCIEKLGISALTIEVGNDNLSHPISKIELEEIKKHNLGNTIVAIKELKKWI